VIRGLAEKLAANPAIGSCSMSVPIPTTPGRSRFGPDLSFSYGSGNGNGPFGFCWSLSLPCITRKTDKGLPKELVADDQVIGTILLESYVRWWASVQTAGDLRAFLADRFSFWFTNDVWAVVFDVYCGKIGAEQAKLEWNTRLGVPDRPRTQGPGKPGGQGKGQSGGQSRCNRRGARARQQVWAGAKWPLSAGTRIGVIRDVSI